MQDFLRANRTTSPTTDFSRDSASGSSLQIFATGTCNEQRENTTTYYECTLLTEGRSEPLYFTTYRVIFALSSVQDSRNNTDRGT